MNKKIFLRLVAIVIASFAVMLVVNTEYTSGQDPQKQKGDGKFEGYRAAIKYSYQIDIVNFKDQLPGGMADGKPITNYDIAQLLEGIKTERDHTRDNLLALELAMDHLEHIPDYYTHLTRMEQQCNSEKLLSQ
jgi:Protein of unknown function (DUF5661)